MSNGIIRADIHGTKTDGVCERCDKNILTNCFKWKGRSRQFCNDCLFAEFGIKIKSIFDDIREKAKVEIKKFCPICKTRNITRDGKGYLKCKECGSRFTTGMRKIR